MDHDLDIDLLGQEPAHRCLNLAPSDVGKAQEKQQAVSGSLKSVADGRLAHPEHLGDVRLLLAPEVVEVDEVRLDRGEIVEDGTDAFQLLVLLRGRPIPDKEIEPTTTLNG